MTVLGLTRITNDEKSNDSEGRADDRLISLSRHEASAFFFSFFFTEGKIRFFFSRFNKYILVIVTLRHRT